MGHEVSQFRFCVGDRLLRGSRALPARREWEIATAGIHPAASAVDAPFFGLALAGSSREADLALVEDGDELGERGAKFHHGMAIGVAEVVPGFGDLPRDLAGGFVGDEFTCAIAGVTPAHWSEAENLSLLLDLLEPSLGAGANLGQFELLDGGNDGEDGFAERSAGVDVQVEDDQFDLHLAEQEHRVDALARVAEQPVELCHDDRIARLNAGHHRHKLRSIPDSAPARDVGIAIEAAPRGIGREFAVLDALPILPLGDFRLHFERDVLFVGTDAPRAETNWHCEFSVIGGES